MNKIVIVTGSPGAGKTTVTSSAMKSGRYKVMNLGTLMLEIAIKKGYVKERDQMRYLSNEKITELRTAAADHIARQDGLIIIDTHATIQQHGRFVPGIPAHFAEQLKGVVGLIYVDADTEAILKRRERDTSRIREADDKRVLDEQRDLNLAILGYYSSHLNIPLYIIHNQEGKVEQSSKFFEEDLKDAFGER